MSAARPGSYLAPVVYEPDEQDEIIGDAMAVGGPAFAEELHWSAMDAAEAVAPWDGNGPEPPEYRRAWLGAARRMVAERRATLDRPATESGDGPSDAPAPAEPPKRARWTP